jgi:hypothetical protein
MKQEETSSVDDLSLEARVEIGATLKLNVGPPKETLRSPEGKPAMMIRDDMGLLIDPKLYAKRRCNSCGGNGVFRIYNAVKIPGAKGKNNMQTEMRTCGCVRRNYGKARTKLGRAFQEALRSQA